MIGKYIYIYQTCYYHLILSTAMIKKKNKHHIKQIMLHKQFSA